MLLGNWKDFSELENSLSLPELEAMLQANREREHRQHKFAAALKGIDIDAEQADDVQFRREVIERRADAIIRGENPETAEWAAYGIAHEVEEE
ncbi:MAG TPA: hypothetical protein VIJ87_06400 [Pyrinomonadaceae bacterium]